MHPFRNMERFEAILEEWYPDEEGVAVCNHDWLWSVIMSYYRCTKCNVTITYVDIHDMRQKKIIADNY